MRPRVVAPGTLAENAPREGLARHPWGGRASPAGAITAPGSAGTLALRWPHPGRPRDLPRASLAIDAAIAVAVFAASLGLLVAGTARGRRRRTVDALAVCWWRSRRCRWSRAGAAPLAVFVLTALASIVLAAVAEPAGPAARPHARALLDGRRQRRVARPHAARWPRSSSCCSSRTSAANGVREDRFPLRRDPLRRPRLGRRLAGRRPHAAAPRADGRARGARPARRARGRARAPAGGRRGAHPHRPRPARLGRPRDQRDPRPRRRSGGMRSEARPRGRARGLRDDRGGRARDRRRDRPAGRRLREDGARPTAGRRAAGRRSRRSTALVERHRAAGLDREVERRRRRRASSPRRSTGPPTASSRRRSPTPPATAAAGASVGGRLRARTRSSSRSPTRLRAGAAPAWAAAVTASSACASARPCSAGGSRRARATGASGSTRGCRWSRTHGHDGRVGARPDRRRRRPDARRPARRALERRRGSRSSARQRDGRDAVYRTRHAAARRGADGRAHARPRRDLRHPRGARRLPRGAGS